MLRVLALFVVAACLSTQTFAVEIRAYSEFFRPDPFGSIVRADWSNREPALLEVSTDGRIHLKAARNAYTSFHLTVFDETGGRFTLVSESDRKEIEVDIFREWFHRNKVDGLYYPDALIPLGSDETCLLPDPEMKIKNQVVSAFWVDVWVPREANPAHSEIIFRLKKGGEVHSLHVQLEILPVIVPDEDGIVADHNSYGLRWVDRFFPLRKQRIENGGSSFEGSDDFFSAIHETHAMLYEHRGLLHTLGYGHAGTVNPLFAPVLTGKGENRRIENWDGYDRHFGPLLDGSAFASTRRVARPIEFLYLTINPEWPASYLDFGTPLFDREFVNVVSEMEHHFREKGWTETNFEMFFNHKKRYKGYEWDGDETRFPKDNVYFKEFGRLLHRAVPEDSPVSFVFRHDASWLLQQQMTDLAGVVNVWVSASSIMSFYPEAPTVLKSRGDIVWIYGGTPSHFSSTGEILDMPVDAWMKGLDGYVRWLTTSPDERPWFESEGSRTGLFFPGARFGVDGPLPSIRLKIQRNCLQDIALLRHLEASMDPDDLRREVASRAGGAKPGDWWNGEAAVKQMKPWDWTNASLREAGKPSARVARKLDGSWWLEVRSFASLQAASVPPPERGQEFHRPTTSRAKLSPFRPEDRLNPEIPKESLQGSLDDQMAELGRLCTELIDGDRCWKIVTDRAEESTFRQLPGGKRTETDNYDVNLEAFRTTKKELIRLSRLSTFPVDCNLWMRIRNRPDQVNAVIRQAKDWSRWYRFGQMAFSPTAEMQRALAGEQVKVSDNRSDLISVLSPVRNSRGEVVGFVEVCHGPEVVVVTQ